MYIVDVMLHIKLRNKNEEPGPAPLEEEGTMEVVPMLLDNIFELSSIRIELPDDLTVKENKMLVKETMREVYYFFFEKKLNVFRFINNSIKTFRLSTKRK